MGAALCCRFKGVIGLHSVLIDCKLYVQVQLRPCSGMPAALAIHRLRLAGLYREKEKKRALPVLQHHRNPRCVFVVRQILDDGRSFLLDQRSYKF